MYNGNTAEEGNLFLQQIPTIALPVVAKLIHLTVEKGPSGYRQRVTKTLTDHIYVTPQVDILKNYSGHAWRYEYQYVLPGSRMGCFHASELPVLFAFNDIFGKADDPESIIVGDKMRRIWGSFAKTGRAEWEEYRDFCVDACSRQRVYPEQKLPPISLHSPES